MKLPIPNVPTSESKEETHVVAATHLCSFDAVLKNWPSSHVASLKLVPPPLSEAEIGFLETQIPAMAQVATQSAFWNALTRGQSVVCQSGAELVEIAPDGTRTILDVLEAGPSLPVGTRISLR